MPTFQEIKVGDKFLFDAASTGPRDMVEMTCTLNSGTMRLFEYSKPARNGQTSVAMTEADWNAANPNNA